MKMEPKGRMPPIKLIAQGRRYHCIRQLQTANHTTHNSCIPSCIALNAAVHYLNRVYRFICLYGAILNRSVPNKTANDTTSDMSHKCPTYCILCLRAHVCMHVWGFGGNLWSCHAVVPGFAAGTCFCGIGEGMRLTRQGWFGGPATWRPTAVPSRHSGTLMQLHNSATTCTRGARGFFDKCCLTDRAQPHPTALT